MLVVSWRDKSFPRIIEMILREGRKNVAEADPLRGIENDRASGLGCIQETEAHRGVHRHDAQASCTISALVSGSAGGRTEVPGAGIWEQADARDDEASRWRRVADLLVHDERVECEDV